ncbi:MAG: NAD(P)H-dependent oxidoreductase subunit E [Bacteroidota bacterium]
MSDKKRKRSRSRLLDRLWEYQLEKGYISGSDMRKIADELKISMVEVKGVISFYHFFHTKPTGHYTIYLNKSIISEIMGYKSVKEAFEKETGAKVGEVDTTGTFGLFETSCIGLSDQEPAALINFRPFVNLTPKKVKAIIGALKKRESLDKLADDVIDNVHHNLGERSIFFREYERGQILKKALKMMRGEIVEELKWSGLSGRGGAFFPTGLKWDICRKAVGFKKYVICNADEGEPGTFKDRLLLKEHIGLLLEGMIIGGYTVGANLGYIYLRAEYYYLKDRIENEIRDFYDMGMLGDSVMGLEDFDFDIKIQMGAGAYVCGEETALIESIEGKRGEPRTKTFFPVEKGLFYKPTIVNNVETFCAAARIIEIGGPEFRELGTDKSTGSKLLSISGDCKKPGIYEIEWGMKVKELLKLCGAKDTKFVQWSGPSGTLLSKEDFNREISYEDLICGGSIMIFDSSRDLWDLLLNFNNFFVEESCGLCTPCRAGNYLVGKRLNRLKAGIVNYEKLKELKNWSRIIKETSRCGLGKTSNNFIIDAMEKFPEVLEAYVPKEESMLDKEFNLEESLVDYSDYALKINKNG